MRNIFNLFKGRLNRRNFLIGHLITGIGFLILITLLVSIAGILLKILPASMVGLPTIILELLVYIIFSIFYLSLYFRRIHDLGWPAISLLLAVIPIVNVVLILFLFFKKGQDHDNKYGNKPTQNVRFPNDLLAKTKNK